MRLGSTVRARRQEGGESLQDLSPPGGPESARRSASDGGADRGCAVFFQAPRQQACRLVALASDILANDGADGVDMLFDQAQRQCAIVHDGFQDAAKAR